MAVNVGRLSVGGTSSPRKGSAVSEEKKDGEEGRKASLALVVSSVRYCRRVRIVPGIGKKFPGRKGFSPS